MSLRSAISPWISDSITSAGSRQARRRRFELARRRRGAPHEVGYFHEVADPYSALVAGRLGEFECRYGISLVPHIVPAAPDWAAPEREHLGRYALRDAIAVAPTFGVSPSMIAPACPDLARRLERILVSAIARKAFSEAAREGHEALAKGDRPGLDRLANLFGEQAIDAAEAALLEGDALRRKQGHYLGATFYYGGEWYWGLDRLPDLEARLRALGLDQAPAGTPDIGSRPGLRYSDAAPGPDSPPLEFFLSLRSPYTYLAAERVERLAKHYGLTLKLRFVMPMVMRGLPVPAAKRRYIMGDCKREAERLGLPFGRVSDPVGRPVERGLAILAGAIGAGRGPTFARSFLSGVFAEGVDAGSDRGLRRLCERSGIAWSDACRWMSDDEWRAVAEENRAEMFAQSLWGVPSFRFGSVSAWGQDRLWLIEDAIIASAEIKASS